jgi:hypothetical protein
MTTYEKAHTSIWENLSNLKVVFYFLTLLVIGTAAFVKLQLGVSQNTSDISDIKNDRASFDGKGRIIKLELQSVNFAQNYQGQMAQLTSAISASQASEAAALQSALASIQSSQQAIQSQIHDLSNVVVSQGQAIATQGAQIGYLITQTQPTDGKIRR